MTDKNRGSGGWQLCVGIALVMVAVYVGVYVGVATPHHDLFGYMPGSKLYGERWVTYSTNAQLDAWMRFIFFPINRIDRKFFPSRWDGKP